MRTIRIAALTLLMLGTYAAICQTATGVNYNTTTPAAPANYQNNVWQNDSSAPTVNVSVYTPACIGDGGTGGTAGSAPAPPAGSAAADYFLRADCTWASTPTPPSFTTLFETVATSTGDMVIGGTSGAPTRVAAGASGYGWVANGANVAPTWQKILQPTNTLGCLDGYDHLPCTVYRMGLTSESAATGSYATAFTTSAAGIYRISGDLYTTTQSSTAFTVNMLVKVGQNGSYSSHGLTVASATIGTSESWNLPTALAYNLANSAAVQWETTVGSGSNTGGVWNIDLTIERIQ